MKNSTTTNPNCINCENRIICEVNGDVEIWLDCFCYVCKKKIFKVNRKHIHEGFPLTSRTFKPLRHGEIPPMDGEVISCPYCNSSFLAPGMRLVTCMGILP